jgi:hypothetical protein
MRLVQKRLKQRRVAKKTLNISETTANCCVADLDSVGSGPFWSNPDSDQDIWDQIRILVDMTLFKLF